MTTAIATTAGIDLPVLHLVTLINRLSGDEKCLAVRTATNRFMDVLRETAHQKAMCGLKGYEIFEALEVTAPF